VVPVFVTNMGGAGGKGAGLGGGSGPINTGKFAAGAGLAAAGGVRTYDLSKGNGIGLQALPKDFPYQLAQIARFRTGVMDITKSVGALDKKMAATIRAHPGAGFDTFALLAGKADMSVSQLTKAMPRAGAAIEGTGAKAKSAAMHTDDWKDTILGANRAVSKVDGRKPQVTWKNPGLADGINKARDMDKGIRRVDGTRPTSHFALPNIGARIAEAARLDSALDRAARDRVATITVNRVTRQITRAADNLAGVVPGFGSSGSSNRSLERAVERGARAGMSDRTASAYRYRR
jgi:hypothetical protein